MNKATFNNYSGNGEIKCLTGNDSIIRDKIIDISLLLQEKTEDTGWKGGVKSTSYRYALDRIHLDFWHADCESMQTISVDNQVVARVYDCYGAGFIEYLNEKTLDKLLGILNSN